ncbi:MAG: radical SAM protein [Bacillota bacterium]
MIEEISNIKKRCALVYVSSYEVAHFKKKRKEFPPFGVLYLAPIIKHAGWDIDLISIDEENYALDLKIYDLVAISMVSAYSHSIFAAFTEKSEFNSNAYYVAGGYHAEKHYKEVFEQLSVNLIFAGEGENSMAEFLARFEEVRNGQYYVNGTYVKDAVSGEISKLIKRKDIVDLNSLEFPARELLNINDVVMAGRVANNHGIKMVHMLFSRGCSQGCKYCGASKDGNNSPTRYRSPENIYAELKHLKEKYEIGGFAIIDDCFLTNKIKARKICDKIAELNLKWSLAARVDQIAGDDDILDVLYSAGCVEIKFGVETGSDLILDKMDKTCVVNDARIAIKNTHQKSIYVKCFIVSGFPFESEQTNKDTLNFLREMKGCIDSVSLLRFTPLPGSKIFKNPEEYGLDKGKLVIENFKNTHLYHSNFNWWKDENVYLNNNIYYEKLKSYIESVWKKGDEIY